MISRLICAIILVKGMLKNKQRPITLTNRSISSVSTNTSTQERSTNVGAISVGMTIVDR